MALISVTRLHLRSWRFFAAFAVYTYASARQVRRADGFLAGALAADAERGAWTITVWRDEAAMRAFRGSGAHRSAMPRLLRWCDEASVAHWTADDPAIPAMDIAFERMRREGRVSKVHHPSERQQQGEKTGASPARIARILTPAGARRSRGVHGAIDRPPD